MVQFTFNQKHKIKAEEPLESCAASLQFNRFWANRVRNPNSKIITIRLEIKGIIAMWMDDDNVSDRAIAKALGRPQRTFADQMKKYRTELRRIRGF